MVLDATSGEALTSLTILNALVPNTDYFWRVTYYDGDWAASPWSLENQLTTTVVDPDGDSNGIPDTQELPGGSLVDLNGNSIPDVTEINAQFKVLDTVTGQGPIAVQAPAGVVTIALAQSTDPADVPALTVRPQPDDFVRGLISLRLTGLAPGSQVPDNRVSQLRRSRRLRLVQLRSSRLVGRFFPARFSTPTASVWS